MTKLITSNYNPKECKIGVVHVGLGAFHRAHQAYYFDALMGHSGDASWGIAAVNMRAPDSAAFSASEAADGYILKAIDADGVEENRHIRAHIAFEDWSKDRTAAAALVALPEVQIVSITVTESGYYMTKDHKLDVGDAAIAAEIEGDPGGSIYAYLRAALGARAASGAGPVTVMCCDNLRYNGKILGRNFRTYLTACGDHELLDWINLNTSFPSSMVDRITPKPTAKMAEEVAAEFDLPNVQAVLCEDFIQWVIEDDFAGRRPELDSVGADMVADVEPFEEAKIRILNGGHTCMAYLGALSGYGTFDQALADPVLERHFDGYEQSEVLPALGEDQPLDLTKYLATVKRRFQNKNIADTIERICFDGVSKMGIFILPTIATCFENGVEPKFGITSVASWYVLAKRAHSGEIDFNYVDPNKDMLLPFFDDDSHQKFTTSKLLWHDLPQKFPAFSTLLTAEINRIDQEYPSGHAQSTHDNLTSQGL
jgi:D-arabinitol 4-dehydrogenase